jgi:hypothetical protein
MAMNALERCHLIGDCNKVLKRAKWYQNGTKSLPQVELPHIGQRKLYPRLNFRRLSGELIATPVEHATRVVDSGYLCATARNWNQNPSSSAAKLENASTMTQRFFDVESDIGPRPVHRDVIVQLPERVDVVVAGL